MSHLIHCITFSLLPRTDLLQLMNWSWTGVMRKHIAINLRECFAFDKQKRSWMVADEEPTETQLEVKQLILKIGKAENTPKSSL